MINLCGMCMGAWCMKQTLSLLEGHDEDADECDQLAEEILDEYFTGVTRPKGKQIFTTPSWLLHKAFVHRVV